ncbi:MAG: MotA/TolQ/ExbB proton channel family protein [Planctomycetia bacterium]
MSKINVLSAMFLRSPIVWGGALAFCFFALIHGGVITDANVIRYLAGHWVEYVETAMFCVGLCALVIKWLDVESQRRRVGEEILAPIPEGGQPAADAVELAEALTEAREEVAHAGRQVAYLDRRLGEALDLVVRTGSADNLEDHLKYLSDLDASRAAQSYGLVRFVIWAVPIMGFLGTVIGITEAIAQLSPTQLENISGVVAGLGVAFDTTATALALSMVLMFMQFIIDRREQSLLGDVDAASWTALVGRFQPSAEADDTAFAVARLGEAVGRSSVHLIAAQEQSWKALEQTAAGSIRHVFEETAGRLQASLSHSLDETLGRWTDSLVQAQSHLASAREDRWARAADALTVAMKTFEHHQKALAGQAELLTRVVDATHNVAALERTLESNLTALTDSGRFEETLATLSAAVQLLAARAQDISVDPRRVDLQGVHRAGKAA